MQFGYASGKEYTLQLNGAHQGPQILPQGKKAGTGYIDFSAAKNLPAKGLTFLVTVTNVLNNSRDQVLTEVGKSPAGASNINLSVSILRQLNC